MKNIDAFIIDRDLAFRRMLSELIGEEEGTTVAGSSGMAPEGEITEELREVAPDVLLLGINTIKSKEMQLFIQLRKEFPHLPIIVMPRHDREGANIALTTLKNGAVEYITKTMNRTGAVQTRDHFMELLIPVVKAVPRINRNILAAGQNIESAMMEIERVSSGYFDKAENPMKLLVIVGCLGGVPALYLLLSTLPENLPVPVVVVQHMPKIFTQVLAEDLNRVTGLKVREAEDGGEIQAGRVYIAPGGYHAKIKNSKNGNAISLNRGPKVRGYRPSMDVLLKSTRNVYGKRVLVAYLSGGGTDGVEGAEVIDIAGGEIIVQNKSSSLLWDLPLKIAILGVADTGYPLQRMGHEISRRLV